MQNFALWYTSPPSPSLTVIVAIASSEFPLRAERELGCRPGCSVLCLPSRTPTASLLKHQVPEVLPRRHPCPSAVDRDHVPGWGQLKPPLWLAASESAGESWAAPGLRSPTASSATASPLCWADNKFFTTVLLPAEGPGSQWKPLGTSIRQTINNCVCQSMSSTYNAVDSCNSFTHLSFRPQ